MQVVEAEFKTQGVSERVSPPFEGLDFVDQSLDGSAGCAILGEAEKSGAAGCNGLAHPFEGLDP
jgi:hypothetical protein